MFIFETVPPKISVLFDDEPVSLGDSVTAQCTIASGDLPIDTEWLFNSKPINSYFGVATSKLGKRVNVLTIESIHAKHAGNYTCQAKNRAGTIAHAIVLIVNGI